MEKEKGINLLRQEIGVGGKESGIQSKIKSSVGINLLFYSDWIVQWAIRKKRSENDRWHVKKISVSVGGANVLFIIILTK